VYTSLFEVYPMKNIRTFFFEIIGFMRIFEKGSDLI